MVKVINSLFFNGFAVLDGQKIYHGVSKACLCKRVIYEFNFYTFSSKNITTFSL